MKKVKTWNVLSFVFEHAAYVLAILTFVFMIGEVYGLRFGLRDPSVFDDPFWLMAGSFCFMLLSVLFYSLCQERRKRLSEVAR